MAPISTTLLAAVCLLLLLLQSAGQVISSPEGNYDQCSAGRSQSPVNIRSEGLKEAVMEPFVFDKYEVPFLPKISYRDFRVVPQFAHPQQVPTVRGGNLPGVFVFEKLHFHWGPEGHQGSEHLLDGRQFDGEMHMVHFNAKYGSITEALRHGDGVASFATWLKAEDQINISKYYRNNSGYQWMKSLADLFLSTKEEDIFRAVQNSANGNWLYWYPLVLRNLFTPQPNEFFRYNGSLTTNTCAESVTWTVFRSPIIVPREFMKMLRQKETTVRAPQPLNNRIIFYGGNMMTYYSGAGLATTPSGLWTLPPLLALLKMTM